VNLRQLSTARNAGKSGRLRARGTWGARDLGADSPAMRKSMLVPRSLLGDPLNGCLSLTACAAAATAGAARSRFTPAIAALPIAPTAASARTRGEHGFGHHAGRPRRHHYRFVDALKLAYRNARRVTGDGTPPVLYPADHNPSFRTSRMSR
jgi:hypothetical protein